jgi:O-antigen ligase
VEAWRWRHAFLIYAALVFTLGDAIYGILLLLVLLAGELFAEEPWWERTAIDWSLIGFIGITLLSALVSPWRSRALWATAEVAVGAPVAIRAVVLASLRRPEFARRFLALWAAGGTVVALLSIAAIGMTPYGRTQTFHLGPNAFGTTMAVVLVMTLGFSLEGPKRRRFLWAVAAVVVAGALVLTWSRGAWLGALVGLIVLAAVSSTRRLGSRILVLALLIAAALPFLAGQWASQATTRVSENPDDPRSRMGMWRVVPRIVADYPVLGTGLNTFGLVFSHYEPRTGRLGPPAHAHNIFLNFAAETGLVGLAAFVVWLASGTLAIWRWHIRNPVGSSERTLSAIVLAALAALLGHQLVDGTVLGSAIAFGLYAFFGLGAAGVRAAEVAPKT